MTTSEETRVCTCGHLAIAHYCDGETDRCSHCNCADYDDAHPETKRRRGDGYRFRLDEDTRIPATTPEQARRAALFACSVAEDVDDARNLLETLGLVEAKS